MKSDAVKQLELDLLQHMAESHPNFPAAYIPKPKRKDTTANDLTRCIIEYIKLHGGQAERISVVGRPQEVKNSQGRVVGVKWTKTNMTIGSADISATIGGKSVKIEVKIGADRQSEAQRKYQADIERAGGIYYVAKDFDSFIKWYNTLWGTKK